MHKIVITGGPCVGKSTTINLLEKMGHRVIPETSKPIIDKYRLENNNKIPWETKDCTWFQNEVFREQLKIETSLVGDGVCFLESALPDRVAICKHEGTSVPKQIMTKLQKTTYEKIFFLDPLPEDLYEKESHRPTGYAHSKQIQNAVKKCYLESGFQIIRVPFDTPKKRVNFILQEVNIK